MSNCFPKYCLICDTQIRIWAGASLLRNLKGDFLYFFFWTFSCRFSETYLNYQDDSLNIQMTVFGRGENLSI
jgi:hypothetical protein